VGLRLQIRRYSISLRCFIFTYDLVAIPWLILEIGQREGVDLWRVRLGLQFPCLTDSPPRACGRSTRSWQIWCSSCFSRVLASPCYPFGLVFLVAQSLANDPHGECGRSLRRGWSASRARIVRFSRCSIGGSGAISGRSVVDPRTVRLGLADGPPSPCGQSDLSLTVCLSLLLLVLRFSLGFV
jgi:hypothetical protein